MPKDDASVIRVQSHSALSAHLSRKLTSMNRGPRMADPLHKTSVRDVEELDELLSEPTEAAIRTLAAIDGDIVILGVGGKMGPTLARMAKRASDLAGVSRRIIGVSRSEEHTSELQSRLHLVCRLLLEKKKNKTQTKRRPSPTRYQH